MNAQAGWVVVKKDIREAQVVRMVFFGYLVDRREEKARIFCVPIRD